jgi:hypothetical protein
MYTMSAVREPGLACGVRRAAVWRPCLVEAVLAAVRHVHHHAVTAQVEFENNS